MFTIEKAIPIPPVARGAATKYQFGEMEVGDSFLVKYPSVATAEGTPQEEVNKEIAKSQQATYNNVARSKTAFVKINAGKELTLRKVEGGVRVWRTA